MIKIGRITYPGHSWMHHVISGIRNSHDSWDKMDTRLDSIDIGENDFFLMKRLANTGAPEERKFLRMMPILVDITAPLYWWKEFDTYKIGTVSNSCSTMHTIMKKPFHMDDFSNDKMLPVGDAALEEYVAKLNDVRERYLEAYDDNIKKELWYTIIQMLPSSYMQKRTIMLNYEVLNNIYRQRRNHKLQEWRNFCRWAETLMYADPFITPREKI